MPYQDDEILLGGSNGSASEERGLFGIKGFKGTAVAAILGCTMLFLGVGLFSSGEDTSLSPLPTDPSSPLFAPKYTPDDVLGGGGVCLDPNFRKQTLKALKDDSFMVLFEDTKGQKKFEASDVITVGGHYYSICDSNWAIEKISYPMTPFSADNKQIGNPNREAEDSGYEGIFHHDGTFFVVRESVELKVAGEKGFHAVVEEIEINADESDYDVTLACPTEQEFEGDSKGFEGATGLTDKDGNLYMLGLCEGNFCREGNAGKDRGHGRVVLMKKVLGEFSGGHKCQWKTVRTMTIPESAFFQDYSALAVEQSTGRVAITSQENSQVWISHLTHFEDGHFDPELSEFTDVKAKVFDFPRDTNCEVVYCNIEGIHFHPDNKNILIAVSDKMKSGGKQSFRCQEKDQSIHLFNLP